MMRKACDISLIAIGTTREGPAEFCEFVLGEVASFGEDTQSSKREFKRGSGDDESVLAGIRGSQVDSLRACVGACTMAELPGAGNCVRQGGPL